MHAAESVGDRCLSSGVPEASQPELPIARVAVDITLNHLDRPFDVDVFESVTKHITSTTTSIPFTVR